MSPAGGGRYAIQQVAAGGWVASAWGTVGAEYDASVASSVHATAGAVDTWDDLSGNARHYTAATTLRPTTGTRTSPSGLNVLDFDGTDDMMSTSSFAQNQPFTRVTVCLNDQGANGNAQIVSGHVTTVTADLRKTATNFWQMTASAAVTSATAPNTSAHVLLGIFNGASSALYLDGASIATGNPGSTALANGLRVGANASGTSRWNGWIAHDLLYVGAVADPAGLSAALKTKWGTV